MSEIIVLMKQNSGNPLMMNIDKVESKNNDLIIHVQEPFSINESREEAERLRETISSQENQIAMFVEKLGDIYSMGWDIYDLKTKLERAREALNEIYNRGCCRHLVQEALSDLEKEAG